jgi:hypothetical protein
MTRRADAQPLAEGTLRVTGRLSHDVAAGGRISQAKFEIDFLRTTEGVSAF